MLKRLYSLTRNQMIIALLFFVSVAYLFTHVLSVLNQGLDCAFDTAVKTCTITYSLPEVIGGTALALIVCYIIFNLLVVAKPTKKRK